MGAAMGAATGPVLTAAEIAEFLDEVFPQVRGEFVIEEVGAHRARVRMPVAERHLRPGGTVSGPSMFALADVAFYIATIAMIGREALTVTTNLNINFMRKPAPGDLVAEARILKLGRSLSVGDVTLFSSGAEAPVAHATCTYAIPPKREAEEPPAASAAPPVEEAAPRRSGLGYFFTPSRRR